MNIENKNFRSIVEATRPGNASSVLFSLRFLFKIFSQIESCGHQNIFFKIFISNVTFFGTFCERSEILSQEF